MMFTHQQMFPYWYLSYKSRPKGQQITHSVHNLINRIDVRKYTILTTRSLFCIFNHWITREKRNQSVNICPYYV